MILGFRRVLAVAEQQSTPSSTHVPSGAELKGTNQAGFLFAAAVHSWWPVAPGFWQLRGVLKKLKSVV